MKTETFLDRVENYIRVLGERVESLLDTFTQAYSNGLRRLGYQKDEGSVYQGTLERELGDFKYVFEEAEEHSD